MTPTIEELLKRAHALDPDMTYSVSDSTIYDKARPDGARRVRVIQAFSRRHGQGSHEDIVIVMGKGIIEDYVLAIEPGSTTLWWQSAPLQAALDELTVEIGAQVAERAAAR